MSIFIHLKILTPYTSELVGFNMRLTNFYLVLSPHIAYYQPNIARHRHYALQPDIRIICD